MENLNFEVQEKRKKVCNYEIILKGKNFQINFPDKMFSANGLFYYTPQETYSFHKKNLKHGWSVLNQAKGLYTQLIGADTEIKNKTVYTGLINLYISYIYDLPEKIRILAEKVYLRYNLTPKKKNIDWHILINSKSYIEYLKNKGVLNYEHEYLYIKNL